MLLRWRGIAAGGISAGPRSNAQPEAAALPEVLKTLHGHPAVAWCECMNSGAHTVEGLTGRRCIRYGFKGNPDVNGQLVGGGFLGVEVKPQGGRLRPEQSIFLERVRTAGGVAFVAHNCADVLRELHGTEAWAGEHGSEAQSQRGGGIQSMEPVRPETARFLMRRKNSL